MSEHGYSRADHCLIHGSYSLAILNAVVRCNRMMAKYGVNWLIEPRA